MQITLISGVAERIRLHFLFENGPLVDFQIGSGDLVQLFRVSAVEVFSTQSFRRGGDVIFSTQRFWDGGDVIFSTQLHL